MTAPRRVQRTRKAGQPGIPDGARYVGRPTRWGNPFRISHDRRGPVVHCPDGSELFGFADDANARDWAVAEFRVWIREPEQADLLAAARRALAGRDLACWCAVPAEGEPDHCHAAVLLQISNSPAEASS
ncbi:DUF4326 domain-containing protein [Streptomyces klenkii]|uniref:DUF4326 domain-containing protein n=1 Tax=Streptomyces klenkii TaxID=1420899 RepID=A0A3B0AMX7_9ACTN|nr:DUF4326 domain-containing protein [Streptomyces klenkii]RKN61893.1 DUF4326 domain-containing protein [Streptomyces klenkii]